VLCGDKTPAGKVRPFMRNMEEEKEIWPDQ